MRAESGFDPRYSNTGCAYPGQLPSHCDRCPVYFLFLFGQGLSIHIIFNFLNIKFHLFFKERQKRDLSSDNLFPKCPFHRAESGGQEPGTPCEMLMWLTGTQTLRMSNYVVDCFSIQVLKNDQSVFHYRKVYILFIHFFLLLAM